MSILPSRVDGAEVAVLIDQPGERKGQNIAAQRCVRVNGSLTLLLKIRIDSSYTEQSRIHTDLHDGSQWNRVWTYSPRDFAAVPNAYSSADRERLADMLAPMYDQMVADALLIVGE